MGPDNSPPQIVPLNSNNKKGPDTLQESLALASMARDDPAAMRGKVGSEFET